MVGTNAHSSVLMIEEGHKFETGSAIADIAYDFIPELTSSKHSPSP
jgi:hypothetical protein